MPLTPAQRDEFNETGLLRVAGLLPVDVVRGVREAVLLRLAAIGLWKDGAWRLSNQKPRWPATGFSTKDIGKVSELETLIDAPPLQAVVNALLENRAADRTLMKRPQLLFSLPNADAWAAPHGWHTDVPRLASGACPGVQLFTFLDTVVAHGGGTAVVAGSHRLLNDGRFLRPRDIARTLGEDERLRDLFSDAPADALARESLMTEPRAIGGVALKIVELTGVPGDAYFMDLRALHSAAPNITERPRAMATHRFLRADVVRELSEGFGWEPAA